MHTLPTSADPSPPAHKPSGAAAQALTAAAVDSLSGDEGSDAMGAKRKMKPRLGPEMDETGNRQCVACGTTQTPKWRCGMTLCNACGLRNANNEQHKQNKDKLTMNSTSRTTGRP